MFSGGGATKISQGGSYGVQGPAGGGYGAAGGGSGAAFGSAYGQGMMPPPGMPPMGAGGSMYGGGGYGMGMGMGSAYGSMYAMGLDNGGFDEGIVVTKIFSSRRDLDRVASTADFPRRYGSIYESFAGSDGRPVEGMGGSLYQNSAFGSAANLAEPERGGKTRSIDLGALGPSGADADGKADAGKSGAGKGSGKDADAAKRRELEELERQRKKDTDARRKREEEERRKREEEERRRAAEKKKAAEAIPQLKDNVKKSDSSGKGGKDDKAPAKKSAIAANDAEQQAKPSGAAAQGAGADAGKIDSNARDVDLNLGDGQKPAGAGASGVGNGRVSRPRSRPRSRSSRPVSRAISFDEIVVPSAQDLKDDLFADRLESGKSTKPTAAQEARREQQEKMREAAKAREEEQRKRREEAEQEQRRKADAVAKMDNERRRQREKEFEEKEREIQAKKRAYEAQKKAEEEAEAARIKALVEERQRQLAQEQEQNKPRSGSRPRSRRPQSRPNSALRGAIPEQPPDEKAGEMKDDLGNELTKAQSDRSGATATTPNRTRRSTSRNSGGRTSALRGAIPEQPKEEAAKEMKDDLGNKVSRESNARTATTTAKAIEPVDEKKPNTVKTLVLVEKVAKSNGKVKYDEKENTFSYNGKTCNVTEVKTRSEGSYNYQSSVVHEVRQAVCRGINAAVLSSEAPNTTSAFESPVWPILNRIVRSVLHSNTNSAGELDPNFELTCAIGYVAGDKVKDLLSPEEDSAFKPVTVSPSPIYGPRIPQLLYGKITSGNGFEEVLSASLARASENVVLSTMKEGAIVAFVLAKQVREENGKKDVFLSSLVVSSAGSDVEPYLCGLNRTRNHYGAIFHVVLGGPCCTCFMLNTADDDTRKVTAGQGDDTSEDLKRLFDLLEQLAKLENYPLRNGSVKRFITYIEKAYRQGQERMTQETDPANRARLERYMTEQQRLLKDAYETLEKANVDWNDIEK